MPIADAVEANESARRSRRRRAWILYGCLVGASAAGPGLARLLRRRLPAVVADTAAQASLIGAGWTTLTVLERVRPFREDWNRPRGDTRTDLAHLLLTSGLVQGANALLAFLLAPLRPVPRRLVRRVPRTVQVAALVLAWDFTHYWHHRLSHERAALWRFHAVHHGPTRLWWMNAFRFHPVDLFLDLAYETLVWSVVQPDRDTRIAYTILRGVHGQLQHANVDMGADAIDLVFATPGVHRWHHSTDIAEGNNNYGAVVSVWDRLFGTLFLPPKREFDGDAGLAGGDEMPEGWIAQLRLPFPTDLP